MTTRTQTEANRANAKRSSGPKTAKGKALARLNAVTHGLRSLAPVLPDECPQEWDRHRAGTVAALAPVGTLETELVERVAILMWRLRRVVRYETAVTAAGIDAAVARVRGEEDAEDKENRRLRADFFPEEHRPQTYATVRKELDEARTTAAGYAQIRDRIRRLPALPDLPDGQSIRGDTALALLREIAESAAPERIECVDVEDREFLTGVGVPEDWCDEPDWWEGWTVGIVRAGVEVIAEDGGLTVAEVIERAVAGVGRTVEAEERKVLKLESLFEYLSGQIAGDERVARGRNALPSQDEVDKVMRYESHLNKQLTQTLHQLERLQALRSGNPPAPPAAMDVTVETGT